MTTTTAIRLKSRTTYVRSDAAARSSAPDGAPMARAVPVRVP